ncbi:MAG TPA: redoxin domain-containing protein [Solirubrobacteraceae bacterium]|nr:redoxin domain-containing protein [Solirubrobacteraceae bacterium]
MIDRSRGPSGTWRRRRAAPGRWTALDPSGPPSGTPQGPGRRQARGLVGRTFPDLRLLDYAGEPVALPTEVNADIVIYLYPGVQCSPDGGLGSAGADVQQHLSFDRHRADLDARRTRVVGVSSEAPKEQFARMRDHRVCHPLWSDPACELAHALELPTFTQAGRELYRRGTLVVRRSRIEIAIYPVYRPEQSATQALWAIKAKGL